MADRFFCPICKKDAARDSSYFPFCSKRCQLLDLGAWASERYSVPVEEAETLSEDTANDEVKE